MAEEEVPQKKDEAKKVSQEEIKGAVAAFAVAKAYGYYSKDSKDEKEPKLTENQRVQLIRLLENKRIVEEILTEELKHDDEAIKSLLRKGGIEKKVKHILGTNHRA